MKMGGCVPPMVGSLFSWNSLLTNRRTREDYVEVSQWQLDRGVCLANTFPTAASPSRTSLTLLLGFGVASAIYGQMTSFRRVLGWVH